ncbi:hypothetical protein H4J50_18010 [Colwellia sp. 6M3]|uniref:hypothetical protein n=1 Tax=Colwellia sp. 6M3 TaxID=2759849 RepID=UPI0015F49B43|nr:hypothetical protein [Colwellia sp. 6M3]MBA6417889.1 hypothetical protein [Colwellia sp. 6M3]
MSDWKRYQIIERGNARMISDGQWKLVRYYKKDASPIGHWYNLTHPMKERNITEPPRQQFN